MQKKKISALDPKLQSMAAESNDSGESEHGFQHRGNPAVIHQKARVMRNNDNGSHL